MILTTRKQAARRSGASHIEYAVILGLILSAICVGTCQLTGSGRALRATAEILPGGTSTDSLVASSATSSDSATSLAGLPLAPRALWPQFAFLAVFAAACFVAVTLGVQLRRERMRNSLASKHHPDDAHLPETLRTNIFAKRQSIYLALSGDDRVLFQSRIEVRHVMTNRLFIVSPTAPAKELADTMSQNQVRHLLVCRDGRLVGVISDRDLHIRHGATAEELMTRDPFTVSVSTPVGRVVTTLISHGFSCVPVVDGDRVIGLVTTTDLMMTLQCVVQLLERILSRATPESNATEATDQFRATANVVSAA